MALNVNAPSQDDLRNQLQRDLDKYNPQLTTAQNEAETLLKDLNTRYKDAHGNPVVLGSLAEWQARLSEGGLVRNGTTYGAGHMELSQQLERVNPALRKLENAQLLVQGTQDTLAAMEAMKKALESGDIAGAIMILGERRTSNLDEQLRAQINQMNARNVQVQILTSELTQAQSKTPPDQATINRCQTGLSTLNNQSQLQMIQIQDLVNKRNQAFEMMSNLLQKFAKTLDSIISNMR
jgi:hypothetical protein